MPLTFFFDSVKIWTIGILDLPCSGGDCCSQLPHRLDSPQDQTETHILPSKRNPASLKTKFVKQYNPFSKELDVSAVHIQASDMRLRFYNK